MYGFNDFDTSGNGQITRSEMQKAMTQKFDGRIDEDEFLAFAQSFDGDLGVSFDDLDKNGDGEVNTRFAANALFKAINGSKNGSISENDWLDAGGTVEGDEDDCCCECDEPEEPALTKPFDFDAADADGDNEITASRAARQTFTENGIEGGLDKDTFMELGFDDLFDASFSDIDKDGDGEISRSEMDAFYEKLFGSRTIDADSFSEQFAD